KESRWVWRKEISQTPQGKRGDTSLCPFFVVPLACGTMSGHSQTREGKFMRLAVFSDIHGNLEAFEAELADCEAIGGADRIWFLGDFALLGTRPVECIRRVKAIVDAAEADESTKGTVRTIRGNTDRYIVTGEAPRRPKAEDADGLSKMLEGMRRMNRLTEWCLEQLA